MAICVKEAWNGKGRDVSLFSFAILAAAQAASRRLRVMAGRRAAAMCTQQDRRRIDREQLGRAQYVNHGERKGKRSSSIILTTSRTSAILDMWSVVRRSKSGTLRRNFRLSSMRCNPVFFITCWKTRRSNAHTLALVTAVGRVGKKKTEMLISFKTKRRLIL